LHLQFVLQARVRTAPGHQWSIIDARCLLWAPATITDNCSVCVDRPSRAGDTTTSVIDGHSVCPLGNNEMKIDRHLGGAYSVTHGLDRLASAADCFW